MRRILPVFVLLLAALGISLAGCATGRTESPTLYDMGPLRAQQPGTLPALPPIGIAEIQAPASLDSTQFFFRLNYVNDQQPRPYAHARWAMTPSQLLLQRVKARIAQAGGVALAASQGAVNVPVLRIEMDDFAQNFDAPGQSSARIGLRTSIFKGRILAAHKYFLQQAPAPSADAAGGAQALAAASDAAITDMIIWLGTLDLK